MDRRPFLVGVMLGAVVLLLFILSLGAIWLAVRPDSIRTAGEPPVQPSGVGVEASPVAELVQIEPTASPTAKIQPTATEPTATSTKPALTATPSSTTGPPTPTPSVVIAPTPTPTPTPIVITSVVTAFGGYVRSGPSVNNPVIGAVERGDQVVLVGVSGNWYQVRLGNPRTQRSYISGDQGWISRNLVAPPSQPVPEIVP